MKANLNLTKWIYEHKVCWELYPYYIFVEGKKEQIGYELDLYAQHVDCMGINPGCQKCIELYDHLRVLAVEILPEEQRPTSYQIETFDGAFHIRPENNLKTEVHLKMLLVHRSGFFSPVDECERKCAREIQANLAKFGAQPKVWSQERRAQHELSRAVP